MGPGDRFAVFVQAGGDPIIVVRPVHVVLDVFFAGPHHLHRTWDLLRDFDRPDNEIHLEPTAEAAAQEVIVDLDFFRRQTSRFRDRGLGEGRHLRSHPDIAAIRTNVDGAVHRLHGGVREERRLVNCLDLLGGARHGLGRVALPARDNSRQLRGRCQLLHEIGGAELRV